MKIKRIITKRLPSLFNLRLCCSLFATIHSQSTISRQGKTFAKGSVETGFSFLATWKHSDSNFRLCRHMTSFLGGDSEDFQSPLPNQTVLLTSPACAYLPVVH